MHNYSMDYHPKEKILFVLAFLAILATPFINEIVTTFYKTDHTAVKPVVISGFSAFAVFGIIFWGFNQYLWKCALIRKFLLMPDLNGKWVCEGTTLIKGGENTNYPWCGEIHISQSWSKIAIRLKTSISVSRSISASISRMDEQGFKILYNYKNDPTTVQESLNKHDGVAEILFNLSCTEGEGHYYTDQHRSTVGSLKLRRIK